MTDVQAAVGRKQLERLPELVSRRRAIAARYAELLGNIEGLGSAGRTGMGAFQLAELLRAIAGPSRSESGDAKPSRPRDRDATRDHVLAPRGAVFRRGKQRHDLRQSELAQDHSILLPIYTQMTEDDLVQIADALKKQVAGDLRRTGLRIGEKIGG